MKYASNSGWYITRNCDLYRVPTVLRMKYMWLQWGYKEYIDNFGDEACRNITCKTQKQRLG